jgi:ketosteroid isomerase-like protein
MKSLVVRLFAGAILMTLSSLALSPSANADARADIKALEERFIAAFKAKYIDAIMRVYVPDQTLFVFDLAPPRQYVGAAAYRKDWQEFLGSFDGPISVELSELAIATDRSLAYGHSIQHIVGTDKQGKKIDLTVRVTDVYKKIKGHWLVVHEHVSVPVDLDAGKPDLSSKP